MDKQYVVPNCLDFDAIAVGRAVRAGASGVSQMVAIVFEPAARMG